MDYCQQIVAHYENAWSSSAMCREWPHGPVAELPRGFCVLEFSPRPSRSMWTYATCCMSQPDDEVCIELHLFAQTRNERHVELMTAVAHYHRTGRRLGLGDTVNFGRGWEQGSQCTFGLISLPYLDGPSVENIELLEMNKMIQCLWLVPITEGEMQYKAQLGVEALEGKFESAGLNYVDPFRRAVV